MPLRGRPGLTLRGRADPGELPTLEGMDFFPPRQDLIHQERALANHLCEWSEVVERDRNHPSIVLWTPLNEVIR